MFTSALAILLVFGLIVAVHEWGHMIAAKLCGVAVPNFALGMGPSLVSRMWRGTRYHLCAFPIGGFVTIAGMEGDDPLNAPKKRQELDEMDKSPGPEEATATAGPALYRSWRDINGFQKAFILAAGPIMNFVLALIVILAMGLVGFPHNAVMLTSVREDTPAAQAGLQAGDMVTAIGGHKVSNARQFAALVQANKDHNTVLDFERAGQAQSCELTPRIIEGFNNNVASLGVGLQEVLFTSTAVNLVSPGSVADRIGLRLGDRVLQFNGKDIYNGVDMLLAMPGFDDQGRAVDTAGALVPADGPKQTLLIERRSSKPGAAAAAGITEGAEGSPRVISDEGGIARIEYSLPADTSMLSLGLAFKPNLQRLPFGESVARSLQEAQAVVIGTVFSLRLMFTEVGLQSLSGPVGISRMIAQSAHSGVYELLQMLMIINLSLGIFNLLPIPALDGGRMVFVALNGIGLRINERREMLVHTVSMVLLLCFIAVVSLKDILAMF